MNYNNVQQDDLCCCHEETGATAALGPRSDVFKSDSDAPFLKRAGVTGFDDPATKSTANGLHACEPSEGTCIAWMYSSESSHTMR